MRRVIVLFLCGVALLAFCGAALFVNARLDRCARLPLLVSDRLAPPDFANLREDPESGPGVPPLPVGWSALARGVQVGNFTVAGGNSFQLLGVANALQTPSVAVAPGQQLCFVAQALADAPSATAVRVRFVWQDAAGATIGEDVSKWLPVRRWEGAADSGGWSSVVAAAIAPNGAMQLRLQISPASDDRVYLDAFHVRHVRIGGPDDTLQDGVIRELPEIELAAWPNGASAALSFSFDWETAMGGLIHSRSDDPNQGQNAWDRAMRMREGVTTTLELFRPFDVHATYYANGYNFLLGNTERREFMGNPTFSWATQKNHWVTDSWQTTPWFSNDPYGTVAEYPEWYFGDLVPWLLAEGQDIQSHTFSHMDGGLADPPTWQLDLAAWNELAAELDVAPARSIAFPWSSSAGMQYASWQALADAGITSVTRTNWSQDQYDLFGRDGQGISQEPFCRPWPGHEQILACPDYYLTEQRVDGALQQLDIAIAQGGMIDLWAHTEEVVSPGQVEAWRRVVEYAAQQRDAGKLWIAPLADIAEWQLALEQVSVQRAKQQADGGLAFVIHNQSTHDLIGVTVKLPFAPAKLEGQASEAMISNAIQVDLSAGQMIEVRVWPE
jgi:hypothetical protein